MADTADKNLTLIAAELKFIRRHVQSIECSRGDDFETVDEIVMAVQSALAALEEYELGLQPDATDDLSLPEAA